MKLVLAIDQAEERSRLELALGSHHQVAAARSLQDAMPLVRRGSIDAVIFDLVEGYFPAPLFVVACRKNSQSADGRPKFVCLVDKPLVVGELVDWLRQLANDDDVSVMVKPIDQDALLSHLSSIGEAAPQPSVGASSVLRLDRKHQELEVRMSRLDTKIDEISSMLTQFQEQLSRMAAKK